MWVSKHSNITGNEEADNLFITNLAEPEEAFEVISSIDKSALKG